MLMEDACCHAAVIQWITDCSTVFKTPASHRLINYLAPGESSTLSSSISSITSTDAPLPRQKKIQKDQQLTSTINLISTSLDRSTTKPTLETWKQSPPPAPPMSNIVSNDPITVPTITLSRNHCVLIQSPKSTIQLKDADETANPTTTTIITTIPSVAVSSTQESAKKHYNQHRVSISPLSIQSKPQKYRNNNFGSSSSNIEAITNINNTTTTSTNTNNNDNSLNVPLMQPYKAESNHRDYSTKASMDRARRFIASLKRVESIVTTSISGNREKIKNAHQILSNVDTNHTGILDRRTFSLACRRLQLGLSRTDIDALIAFLRSRKFACKTNQLKSGHIKWRWFLIQFCGMKYVDGGEMLSSSSTQSSSPSSSSSLSLSTSSSPPPAAAAVTASHDYFRVINNHMSTKKHHRPRTADTLKKARMRMKKQQRPASSGTFGRDKRRRGGNGNSGDLVKNKSKYEQRPTSVPYKKKRSPKRLHSPKRLIESPKTQQNKKLNSNLASMASAIQRGNGRQNWTYFGGGERKSHTDIAKMMLRRPSSPSKAKIKRASPLLTARLRPFFGTVHRTLPGFA
jgi:hypothetical protein